jgi:hypothetical protein
MAAHMTSLFMILMSYYIWTQEYHSIKTFTNDAVLVQQTEEK